MNTNIKTCAICDHHQLSLVINLQWPLYRCQNCGLVQVSPLPSKTAVHQLYQGDYWKNYGPYGSQENAHRQYFQKKLLQIKKYKKTGRLLDVGCALGTFLIEAKKQGFDVLGIDISDYAVKQCQKRGLKVYQATLSFLSDGASEVNSPENRMAVFSAEARRERRDRERQNLTKKYDLITTFETLEHEYDPLTTIKIIFSLLKPNGLLVLTVPNTDTLTRYLMGRFWFGWRNREHLWHFNKKSLQLLLKKAGFKKIIIQPDSPRPYLLTYYLERANFYLFRSKFLAKIIEGLKKIPIINNLEINFNSWGNLIAFAVKKAS